MTHFGRLIPNFSWIQRIGASALICLVHWTSAFAADAPLEIDFPSERLVFQRDFESRASIPIRGRSSEKEAKVEFRFLDRKSGSNSGWAPLASVAQDGTFSGHAQLGKGWYSLELRALAGNGSILTNGIQRVGVGEVFIVVGHSVAQGGELNLPGAVDDRVSTIAVDADQLQIYEKTGKAEHLPDLVGSKFENGVQPAPFGQGTYFWSAFAAAVTERLDVPVLILNAAFGGTSLAHWAKSARGESFEHSFVRSEIRMPYVNLKNALQKYAAVLGVRAILSDQGQNDAPEENADLIFENYKCFIDQARRDLGFERLAFVINRQTPYLTRKQIRAVQERVIRETPFTFAGPDYDFLSAEDRPDKIHLGIVGMHKAAKAWSDVITTNFLERVEPFCPTSSRR